MLELQSYPFNFFGGGGNERSLSPVHLESNAIRQAALDESVIPFYPNMNRGHVPFITNLKSQLQK